MKELSEILKLITNGTVELENTDMFDLVSLPSNDSTTSSETSSASSNENLNLQDIENISDEEDNVSDDEEIETDELSNWQNISPQEILEELQEIKEKLNLMNNYMESAAEMLKLNGSQMDIEFKNIQNELRQFRQRMDDDNATINDCNIRTPMTKSYLNLVDRERSSLFNQRFMRTLFLVMLMLLLFFAVVYYLPSVNSSSFRPINYKMPNGKVPV